MGDPPTPPRKPPFEEELEKNPRLRAAVLALARRQVGSEPDAEDVMQGALLRAIRYARATGEPIPPEWEQFLLFAGSFVNSNGSNMRKWARRHPRADVDVADPTKLPLAAPDADAQRERVAEDLDVDARYEEVRLEILAGGADKRAGDPRVALGVLDCAARGVHKAEDVAAELRCRVADVYNAHRRLVTAGKKVDARRNRAKLGEVRP